MSLQIKPLQAGRLLGGIYTADAVGDSLPMHSHGETDTHITIIARGSFRVHGPKIGDNVYKAGAVFDWQPGIAHEFIALEAGARFINIIKGSSA